MSEDLLASATHLGAVHLRVVDVPAALPVWVGAVGLAVLGGEGTVAELGVDGKTLIVLHEGADVALPQKSRDLFHVAIHVMTRRDLAHAAARLKASGRRYSAQDHLISESLYVSDPSGNGIEICFDSPERFARREETPEGRVSLIATDGSAHSGLEPLDVGTLLRDLGDSGHVDARLAADAFIGHIHMRARSPETLMAFYLGVLGFRPHIQSRTFGMFDCGTGQRRHMIAFNIWARGELTEPPPGAAGLERYTVVVPSAEDLASVVQRLDQAHQPSTQTDGALHVADPEGNRLRIVVAGD